GNAARSRLYSTRTPSLSGVVSGCGVWSTKSSANSSSNRRQLPLPCTCSVFRRTTAIAASPTDELLILVSPLTSAHRRFRGTCSQRPSVRYQRRRTCNPDGARVGCSVGLRQLYCRRLSV